MTPVTAVDLFCGAGGTSTGLGLACKLLGRPVRLLAVNHWDLAVETHAANHPDAEHRCESLDTIDPRKAVPGGRVHLLVASPECTHHSSARGGRPISDQSRASAWQVLRWCSELYVDSVLIENVPEFRSWGPLGANGRPLPSKKGETFAAFIEALRSLGYHVEHRVLNAADYGDATTRRRLFILASRRRRPVWPTVTHTEDGGATLWGETERWRAARSVIDWSIESPSIFGRKKPLAQKTLDRIAEGLWRFGGKAAEPFLVTLRQNCGARSLDLPVPTIAAQGTHVALCEPYVLSQQSGGAPRPVSSPLPTVATSGAISLVQPFLVPGYGERKGQRPRTHSVDAPVPTIPASPKFGLVEPFLTTYYGTGGAKSVDRPCPTLTTKARLGLCEPQLERGLIDIRFRMLQPHELAAAMSFPRDYRFAGNKAERIKQIGNAVPVETATALCRAVLEGRG